MQIFGIDTENKKIDAKLENSNSHQRQQQHQREMSRVRKWREKTVINLCAASPQSVAKNKIMSHARDNAIANQCVERKSVCVCDGWDEWDVLSDCCCYMSSRHLYIYVQSTIDVSPSPCRAQRLLCVSNYTCTACCGAYKFPSWFVFFWFERSRAEKTSPPNSWKEHCDRIVLPNARCQIAHQSSLHLLLDGLVFRGSLAQVPPHTHSAKKHRNLNV